jgi:hypothetical protein
MTNKMAAREVMLLICNRKVPFRISVQTSLHCLRLFVRFEFRDSILNHSMTASFQIRTNSSLTLRHYIQTCFYLCERYVSRRRSCIGWNRIISRARKGSTEEFISDSSRTTEHRTSCVATSHVPFAPPIPYPTPPPPEILYRSFSPHPPRLVASNSHWSAGFNRNFSESVDQYDPVWSALQSLYWQKTCV